MGEMLGYFNAELDSNKPASTHSERGDVWLCADCDLHSKILWGSTQMWLKFPNLSVDFQTIFNINGS